MEQLFINRDTYELSDLGYYVTDLLEEAIVDSTAEIFDSTAGEDGTIHIPVYVSIIDYDVERDEDVELGENLEYYSRNRETIHDSIVQFLLDDDLIEYASIDSTIQADMYATPGSYEHVVKVVVSVVYVVGIRLNTVQ